MTPADAPSPSRSFSRLSRLRILALSGSLTALAVLAPVTGSWAATSASATSAAGQCKASSVVEEYPNGQIPVSVLCAVRGTSNEFLRADAAYNFNRLSRAYKERFGSYICVTDTYRSLKSQISLYKAKPKLAAKPGTSNHGLGVAADLCGGIEKYASIRHAWMEQNAPKFRWVLPAWAVKGGGREEPWHFEYAPRSDAVHDALGIPRVAYGGYNGYVSTLKKPTPVTTPKVTTPKVPVKATSFEGDL